MKSSNITKVWLDMMFVLSHVTIELSNMRKKIREPLNVTKMQLYVILVLSNVKIEPSNVKKKK